MNPYDQAIELASATLELIELIDELDDDVRERNEAFYMDVAESVGAVLATIETTGRVSPKQLSALRNWHNAIAAQND